MYNNELLEYVGRTTYYPSMNCYKEWRMYSLEFIKHPINVRVGDVRVWIMGLPIMGAQPIFHIR